MAEHIRRISVRATAIILLLLLLLIYFIRSMLLPFVLAGAVALAVNPLIEAIERRWHVSRLYVGMAMFALIVAALAAFAILWLPTFLRGLYHMLAHMQEPIQQAIEGVLGTGDVELLGTVTNAQTMASHLVQSLRDWLAEGANGIIVVALSFASVMGGFLSLVLLFYFLVAGPRVGEGLLDLVPPRQRSVARRLWGATAPMLRRYFLGLAAIVTFTFAAAYLGIGIALGLPNAALLAALTAVLELIPVLGPLASAALVGVVALENATGLPGILGFMIYAIALRLSIDQLIGPVVLGRAAHIHPVLVIFCFLAGAVLFGVVGAILAIPVALIIKIMLAELYGEHELGEIDGGLGTGRSGSERQDAPGNPAEPFARAATATLAAPLIPIASEPRPSLLRGYLIGWLRRRLGNPTPLPLRLTLWDGQAVDFGPEPSVTLHVKTPAILRLMMRGDMSGLGDAYARGDIDVDGTSTDIIRVGIAIAERIGRPASWLSRAASFIPRRPRHSKSRDADDIAYHYDVSNDFYALWLDRRMVYSCAYFPTGTEMIDEAQEAKLDLICRKLQLEPGDRFLDIGCGWGALVVHAARHYGVVATGVTLSRQQCDYARDLLRTRGLDGRASILLQDYRELDGDGSYDKIASVGMYEHVGLANLPLYFDTIRRLLKPGGALLNHGIATSDPHGRPMGPPGGEFIDRHVFPGGELPHLSLVLAGLAEAGLEPIDLEDLRPHYARTLRHWVRRLEDHAGAACSIAGPERYRIWRLYMAGMAEAFDRGWLTVGQVLAMKPAARAMAARPWSREYIYADHIRQPAPPPSGGQTGRFR